MKANELMIGDWVLYNGKPIQVDEIFGDGINADYCGGEIMGLINEDELLPIPLTAEILKKNGFEICNEDTDGTIQYDWGSPALGIDIWINTKPCLFGAWRTWEGETKSYTMVEELPINYVHELQHALKLCGIEKEITI